MTPQERTRLASRCHLTYPLGLPGDEERSVSGTPLWHLAAVEGELDLASGPALAMALIGSAGPAGAGVVVDLGAVTFCDSTGLWALAAVGSHLRSIRRDLALRNPSPTVTAIAFLLFADRDLLERPDQHRDCRRAC